MKDGTQLVLHKITQNMKGVSLECDECEGDLQIIEDNTEDIVSIDAYSRETSKNLSSYAETEEETVKVITELQELLKKGCLITYTKELEHVVTKIEYDCEGVAFFYLEKFDFYDYEECKKTFIGYKPIMTKPIYMKEEPTWKEE